MDSSVSGSAIMNEINFNEKGKPSQKSKAANGNAQVPKSGGIFCCSKATESVEDQIINERPLKGIKSSKK